MDGQSIKNEQDYCVDNSDSRYGYYPQTNINPTNFSMYGLTPNRRTDKMSEACKLLKGTRAEIAQSRMPPLTVVPNLNVLKDGLAS